MEKLMSPSISHHLQSSDPQLLRLLTSNDLDPWDRKIGTCYLWNTFAFAFFACRQIVTGLPKFYSSHLFFVVVLSFLFVVCLCLVWVLFWDRTSLYPEWPQALDLPDSAPGITGYPVSQVPFIEFSSTEVVIKRTRDLPHVYLPMPETIVP